MPLTVPATDAQKNFGYWHDKAMAEPVQITEHGRESPYLVSAETFHELWSCYRRRIEVRDLSDAEMAMIMAAEIPAEHAYEFDDLEAAPEPGAASRTSGI